MHKKYRIKTLKFIILVIALGVLSSARQVSAQTPPPIALTAGEGFQIQVGISSPDASINAIEGKLLFVPELLKVLSVDFSSSIVSLWIEQPKVSQSGAIKFSGAIPGGAQGDKLNLFTMYFEGKTAGTGEVLIKELRGLKNDGLGSLLELPNQRIEVQVKSQTVPETVTAPAESLTDLTPPENFEISFYFDENIDGGKWVAIFHAQDKQSGINRYEVWETKSPESRDQIWESSTGYYTLKDQSRQSYIFVRAIDEQGNVKLVQAGPLPKTDFTIYLVVGGGLVAVILYIIVRLYFRHRKYKNPDAYPKQNL